MDISKIGTRYARALFSYGEEKGLLDEFRKDIDLLYSSIQEINDINLFLESPVIQESKKHEFISQLLKGKVNEYIIHFLNLIISNNREHYIEAICRNFIDFYREYKGIRTAVITTAIPLNRSLRDNIYKGIEKELKAKIELTEKVNPKIVGGFLLQIDGIQYDASIASRLYRIKRDMIASNIKQT